jgi:hypothetical protein
MNPNNSGKFGLTIWIHSDLVGHLKITSKKLNVNNFKGPCFFGIKIRIN